MVSTRLTRRPIRMRSGSPRLAISPSWRASRSATAPRLSAPAACAARSPPPRWRARRGSRRRVATAPTPAGVGAAARVRRGGGSSLRPVGIVAVDGSFDAGDAVEITSDGEVVGKGIVEYSSMELAQVIGWKSAEVRELLPHAADEVMHRDRFVLV